MRLKRYLILEKTFNIKKDVDILYKKGFEKVFKIFKENDFEEMQKKLKKIFRQGRSSTTLISTDSSILKSPEAVMAHNVNPVTIDLGSYVDGNFYRPSAIIKRQAGGSGKKGEIQISMNAGVMDILMRGDISSVAEHELVRFANELSSTRIKSSISHELSHWISDSLYNKHISSVLDLAAELTNMELVKLGKKDVNMTYFEIDGQIHVLKELKRANKDELDELSLLDVFNSYTTLYTIASNLKRHGKDVLDLWQKTLLKRMARENLLGKNMKSFVKPNQLIR